MAKGGSKLHRRGLLLGALSATLGGCGFHPMYQRASSGQLGTTSRELAAVSVDIIGDRPGQLLRQALQERLEGSGSGVARRYDLAVGFGISGEGIAIRQDNSVTRIRMIGRAEWTLRAQDLARTVLTRDTARAVDDLNILNEQFFAADLETEVVQKRLAERLADQVVMQLASYFNRRADQAASSG
ncbi:MAG TPA: LPS assembly lipoprotein LptE [Acetobacteraceae bacterium]|nr:LPS assembly lipoprotein LptE [Acetobacteraceae bacterium]